MNQVFMWLFDMDCEQEVFWQTKNIPFNLISQVNVSGTLSKLGKLFNNPTERRYFLSSNILSYGKSNKIKDVKGYTNIINSYLQFKQENSLYYIILSKRHSVLQLLTKNLEVFQQFLDHLKLYCIQFTFDKDFTLGLKLGQGSSSNVHLAVSQKDEGKVYAVKIYEKKSKKNALRIKALIANETKNLLTLKHPNIVRIFGTYESAQYFYILTEHCSGGLLLRKFEQVKSLALTSVKQILWKLLLAVSDIHQHGIMHRDIKPSNIMFLNEQTEINVILIDFGFSTSILNFNQHYMRCGSPGYIAPEILNYIDGNKIYNEKVDIFSLGVTFFVILYGFHPIKGKDNMETVKNNMSGKIQFPQSDIVGPLGEDLIQCMVRINPKERISAQVALNHPFFNSSLQDNQMIQLPTQSLSKERIQKLTLNLTKPKSNSSATQKTTTAPFNITYESTEIKLTDRERKVSVFSQYRKNIENNPIVQVQQQQQPIKDPILEDSFYQSESEEEEIFFSQVRVTDNQQKQSPFARYKVSPTISQQQNQI